MDSHNSGTQCEKKKEGSAKKFFQKFSLFSLLSSLSIVLLTVWIFKKGFGIISACCYIILWYFSTHKTIGIIAGIYLAIRTYLLFLGISKIARIANWLRILKRSRLMKETVVLFLLFMGFNIGLASKRNHKDREEPEDKKNKSPSAEPKDKTVYVESEDNPITGEKTVHVKVVRDMYTKIKKENAFFRDMTEEEFQELIYREPIDLKNIKIIPVYEDEHKEN